MPQIVSHVWRPPCSTATLRSLGPVQERPCEFMSCRRPRAEHVRSVAGKWWR